MSETARMLAYLLEHDNPAAMTASGEIMVWTPYSDGRRLEVIAATWAAVRAHLGY